MQVDGSDLQRASRAFAQADVSLTADVKALFAQVPTPSEICGHDQTGKQAEVGFTQAQKNLESYVAAIANAYDGIAGGLDLMARNVDTANWNVRASLPKVV